MSRLLTVGLLAVLAAVLWAAVAELPAVGWAEAPVHTHVSARYVEHGAEETGAPNLVTAVLLNYRSLDTFGEVLVLFTALAAGFAVLLSAASAGAGRPEAGAGPGTTDEAGGRPAIPVAPVVSFVVRLLAPFIALFGVYVIVHGHVAPGGGFQGGMILAALFIALHFVLGRTRTERLLPVGVRPWLYAVAPLAFLGVGTLGLLVTGHFLGYPPEPSLHLLREGMVIALEVAIGAGGMAIIASLFLVMERQ